MSFHYRTLFLGSWISYGILHKHPFKIFLLVSSERIMDIAIYNLILSEYMSLLSLISNIDIIVSYFKFFYCNRKKSWLNFYAAKYLYYYLTLAFCLLFQWIIHNTYFIFHDSFILVTKIYYYMNILYIIYLLAFSFSNFFLLHWDIIDI